MNICNEICNLCVYNELDGSFSSTIIAVTRLYTTVSWTVLSVCARMWGGEEVSSLYATKIYISNMYKHHGRDVYPYQSWAMIIS